MDETVATPRDVVIYLDADACPVKDEAYKVARRYGLKVFIVANSPMGIPKDANFELVVQTGFGAADDWIAARCGPGDVAVTADVPLAARCVANGSTVLDPRGRKLTDGNVGAALATRNLMEELRQSGTVTGGPAAFTAKDRSRFLSSLDEAVHAGRRVLRSRT